MKIDKKTRDYWRECIADAEDGGHICDENVIDLLDDLDELEARLEAVERALREARDANRYHQALGAKWMNEAIVSDLRSAWDDQTASYFEHKWEDRDYWDKTRRDGEKGQTT